MKAHSYLANTPQLFIVFEDTANYWFLFAKKYTSVMGSDIEDLSQAERNI